MEIVAFLIFWTVVAITAAIVAGNKNRSGVAWFFICFLLSPLAILPLLALRPLNPPPTIPRHYDYRRTPADRFLEKSDRDTPSKSPD